MKLHEQLCGLALGVNLVADHWTLLIVRELLPGARRFSDLRTALAPVASNLLSHRLKQMQVDGLVEATVLSEGPVAAYALTPRGRGLRETVEALVRWSIPEVLGRLGQGFREDPRWLAVALPALVGPRWDGPAVDLGIEVGPLSFVLELRPDQRPEVRWSGGRDVTVRGPYAPVLGLFCGVVVPGDGPGRLIAVEGDAPGWRWLLARVPGESAPRTDRREQDLTLS